MGAVDLADWLRQQCAEYKFDLAGVFRRDSEAAKWPVTAASPAELEAVLARGGADPQLTFITQ
jgi:hypothetical protein